MKKLTELERYQVALAQDNIIRVLRNMRSRRLTKREVERMNLFEEAVSNFEAVLIMK